MKTENVSKAYYDAATGAAIGEFFGFLKPEDFKFYELTPIQKLDAVLDALELYSKPINDISVQLEISSAKPKAVNDTSASGLVIVAVESPLHI